LTCRSSALAALAILAAAGEARAFSCAPPLGAPRLQGAGRSPRGALSVAGSHRVRGAGLRGLLAQQESENDVSLIDKVASKGIWQGGELPEEAQEALQRVGWVEGKDDPAADALPAFTREDIPFIVQQAVADETFADERSKDMFQDEMREKLLKQLLEGEVQSEFGVGLQDLLNPIKVVSLEKKILAAKAKLAEEKDAARIAEVEQELNGLQKELTRERRGVMMDGLKVVFRGQAVFSIVAGGLLAFDKVPLYADVPIAARAFGFWTMWLFTIPSLRAVKPLGYPQWGVSAAQEKKALNLAFVLTPLTTIALPFATKDPAVIYSVNLALVAACYAFYIAQGDSNDGAGAEVEIKGLLKYLDYGSGKERGARK